MPPVNDTGGHIVYLQGQCARAGAHLHLYVDGGAPAGEGPPGMDGMIDDICAILAIFEIDGEGQVIHRFHEYHEMWAIAQQPE